MNLLRLSASLAIIVAFWGGNSIAFAQDIGTMPGTLRVSSQEVLVDFVIRDKQQKLIRNLKPEEVQILDIGYF